MGEKEYQHQISTKELERELLLEDIDHLVELCKKHCINTFTVLFGWSWGNDYYDWTPQELRIDELKNEISQAEKTTCDMLEDNDVLVTIPKYSMEIRYCHHSDIHMKYDEENEIVKAIRKRWKDKEWEAGC